jgi:alkylation response protein AidB-like acyl-CoA dehydrogenase
MDFSLTSEQQEIQNLARDFTQKEVAPAQLKMDESHEFPYELWQKWSDLGMAGMLIPEKYGGSGIDPLTYILALEEVATESNTFALIWQVHVLVSEMFRKFASAEQKDYWLPKYAKGEKLAAFALTEAGAGSDSYAMTTKAELEGNQWTVNGNKIFISNAGTDISDGTVLMAVTGLRDDGKKEISSFILPRDADGFTLGQSFKKMAWHGMDNRELVFENCRIPAANIMGERGAGLRQALGGLNLGRIAFGAIATGLSRGCLEESLAYTKQREQFGQPLSSYQLTQAKLSNMACGMEASRRLTHYAAYLFSNGMECRKEAAMAKLFGTQRSTEAAMDAFQLHGGSAFMEDTKVNRFYREAKILEIGEGTNEIQQLYIARQMGC